MAAYLGGLSDAARSPTSGATGDRWDRAAVSADSPAVAEPVPVGQLRARRHRAQQAAPADRGEHPERAAGHAAAQRSQPDRARSRDVPLVRRRRDGARDRAARRRGSLSQPLGSHRHRRRTCSTRSRSTAQPAEANGVPSRAQTSIVSHAGKILALYEVVAADRDQHQGGHDRALRLRRRAANADDGPSQDRSGDRRDAVLRVRHLRSAVPALPRRRPARPARALEGDHDPVRARR